jgi:hypothetical protein
MPKVTFVNEHRTIECEKGRLISDVASDLGIAVCRESLAGTGLGGYSVWVKGEPGAVSELTFIEKLWGAKGMRRYANRTRILGDLMVWTQAGLGDRLRAPRPVAAPPHPATDKEAPRLGVSAAGTAAFPYGHPAVVGQGAREAIAKSTAKVKAAKGAKAEVAEEDDAEDEAE